MTAKPGGAQTRFKVVVTQPGQAKGSVFSLPVLSTIDDQFPWRDGAAASFEPRGGTRLTEPWRLRSPRSLPGILERGPATESSRLP